HLSAGGAGGRSKTQDKRRNLQTGNLQTRALRAGVFGVSNIHLSVSALQEHFLRTPAESEPFERWAKSRILSGRNSALRSIAVRNMPRRLSE
ncbi:MAG TPA: hypothetical protein VK419_04020, partial [Bryobacteraceae bacterium]|nr:hypothetical protein [Bryobacteraceae bacterium]